MGFSLGTLTGYTDQEELKLLVATVYEPETAQILNSAGQILKGIKSSKALPILESTIEAQAGACGFTASGSTAITQRTITVKNPMFMDSFCPKDLEPYFTQKGLSPGNPEDLGTFQTQIGDEISGKIKEWTEVRIWQGDTSNTGEWDGFKTLLDDAGFGGASDPVEGNPSSWGGQVFASAGGITTSNIDEVLAQIQTVLPAKVRAKSITAKDVVAFCGTDTFQKAVMNLADRNLFHFMPPDGSTSHYFPGCTYKLVAVPGLDGTDVIIASRLNNMFLGTDLLGEEEEFKIWWSQDLQKVLWKVDFKYGAQFAFLTEVVYFKPA